MDMLPPEIWTRPDAPTYSRLPSPDKARQAIAVVDDLNAAKKLVDGAKLTRDFARAAKHSEAAQFEWSVISLEAQRKAGQLLDAMPKHRGGHAPEGTGDIASPVPLKEVLEVETNSAAKQIAKRWSDIAKVPKETFEEYVEKTTKPKDLTRSRLLRIARDAEAALRRETERATEQPAAPDDIDVRLGDFREVLRDLRDIDAIITDPPYPKEFLPLLGDLAEVADEMLAPDGILAVMMGHIYLPDVYRLLSGGRPYRWTMAYLTPGAGYSSHARRLQSNWKPVLVYGGGPRFADVVQTDRDDKRHHKWGQDYVGFETLVTRLTAPGAHVVDPFLGGGTTAIACRNTGRKFTGADIDPDAVDATVRRLEDQLHERD